MSRKTRRKQPQSAQAKQQTSDGLVNVVSGLGMQKAKRTHNQFEYSLTNGWAQLDNAYQSSWLARQIVNIPAEDMTREWRTIKSDGANEIRTEEDRLGVPMAVNEAVEWARLYGGSGMLMLTGQDLSKPLNLSKIKKGDLERVLVFDRFDLVPQTLNTFNVLAGNYLEPEYYILTGGSVRVHWSHVCRFNGAKLPRRLRVITQGWGDSELRKCLDDIKDIVASKDGIAELMQEANVDIITRDGLSDELATDQDDAITKRYALFSQMKSLVNMALLDGNETYDRKTLELSGVSSVLETFMTWISGAADIPVTRLFGTSAKGLNATGAGDTDNYFNSIRSKQLSQIDPGLRTLDEVLVRSALGYWPDDFNYVWNPLKQLDSEAEARAAKAQAEVDVLYLENNVIQVSQVQRRLQASESYQFDDDQIEAQEEAELSGEFDNLTQPDPEPVDDLSL